MASVILYRRLGIALIYRLGSRSRLRGDRQCKRLYKLHAKDRAGVDLHFAAFRQQQAGKQATAKRRRARRRAAARQQNDTRGGATDAGAAIDVLSRLFTAMAAAHLAFVIGFELFVLVPIVNSRQRD